MLGDLRDRGIRLIVVDLLTTEPALARRTGPEDSLTLRLWRLDRAAQRYRLAQLGVPVVPWSERVSLEEVLAPRLLGTLGHRS